MSTYSILSLKLDTKALYLFIKKLIENVQSLTYSLITVRAVISRNAFDFHPLSFPTTNPMGWDGGKSKLGIHQGQGDVCLISLEITFK